MGWLSALRTAQVTVKLGVEFLTAALRFRTAAGCNST